MTASELKYLIATNELNKQECGAKPVLIAKRLNVSKVSVCKAVEKLSACGYLEREGRKIVLTETGKNAIAEYLLVVDFIGDKITRHCKTPKEIAFDEAVVVATALGDMSRKGVVSFVKNGGAV